MQPRFLQRGGPAALSASSSIRASARPTISSRCARSPATRRRTSRNGGSDSSDASPDEREDMLVSRRGGPEEEAPPPSRQAQARRGRAQPQPEPRGGRIVTRGRRSRWAPTSTIPRRRCAAASTRSPRCRRHELLARSTLYRTAPVGYADQPDFVNACALVETALAPRALLDGLLAIERRARPRARPFPTARARSTSTSSSTATQ